MHGAIAVLALGVIVTLRTAYKAWGQRIVDAQAAELAKTFEREAIAEANKNKANIDAVEVAKEKAIGEMNAKELEKEINE